MRIQHNIMAMNAYRNYNTNTSALSKNLEKLSSGYKINRAGDDAAGLAISEKMRAQITGLNAAQKNVKDGISLVKTAEGAMQEIQDMLNRMDYLATQSANGTYDDPVDRYNLQKEVNQLRSEINRIADSANFNGIKLLDGSLGEAAGTVTGLSNSVEVGTVTAGRVTGGGTAFSVSMDTATLHTQNDAVGQNTVAFTIDLAGLSAKVSADGEDFTIKVGGNALVTIGSLVSDDGATDHVKSYTAAEIAALCSSGAAAPVTQTAIEGVTFNITVDGTKLKFEMAANQEYGVTTAGSINAFLTGGSVNFAGNTNISYTPGVTQDHGLTDITYAQNATGEQYAGADFDLTNAMQDGSQLTIGDTTFVFQTEKTGSVATTNGITGTVINGVTQANVFLVNVSGKEGATAQAQEAARIMSLTTGTSADGKLDGYTGKITNEFGAEFKLTTANGKLHIEQKTKGRDSATKEATIYDTGAKLQGLFSGKTATTTQQTGAISFKPTVDISVTVGDRMSFGDSGKTYIITEAGSSKLTADVAAAQANDKVSEIYITADDFKTEITKYALGQAEKKVGETAAFSNYTLSSASDGTYTLTQKTAVSANSAALNNLVNNTSTTDADSFMEFIGEIQVQKLTEADVAKNGLKLQIGDTSDSFNQLSVKVGNMHTDAMGIMSAAVKGGIEKPEFGKSISDIDISTAEGAHDAIDVIKNAINYVSSIRGDLGATQNRLEHTANNLSVMAENIQDAESTIRDTDVAEEMMAYTKNNILVQSAQAMLAQANAVPQGVLQLLG